MSLLDKASLIITPNAYKESKLYSVVPSDGSGDMDVVRATTATRVNADGLIETVPKNLLLRSEQFNIGWGKVNATITANVTTAPNGTLTADKLVENTANTNHYLTQPITNQNSLFTYSVYAKKAERDFIFINAFATTPNNFTYVPSAYFNLSNGTIGTVSNCNASIQDAGNGWYRCTIQSTSIFAQTSANVAFYNYTAIANNNNSYLGDGTSGVFIWGAQLEAGSTSTSYFPTTDRLNIPRIDYTGGGCPSILVEPQRTNLVLRSEEFDNANWTKANCTVTANQTESPSGYVDADLVTSLIPLTSLFAAATVTASTEYIFSFYVKRGTMTDLAYRVFNLTAGTDIVAPTSYYSQTTASGWSRITLSFTIPVGCTSARVYPISNSGVVGTVYLWGAQLEAGSYPTSYIPTLGSTVTRNADVISKTGISDLIGQTEGTIYIKVKIDSEINSSSNIINLGKNTTNSISLGRVHSTGKLKLGIWAGGGLIFNIDTTTTTAVGEELKLAIKYKSGGSKLYVNGVQQVSSTAAFTFSALLNEINVNDSVVYFAYQQIESVYSVQLYKEALTDEQLIALTTI
jgi:hypothetical protein